MIQFLRSTNFQNCTLPCAVSDQRSFQKLAELTHHGLDARLFHFGLAGLKLMQVDHLDHDRFQILGEQLGIRRVCGNARGQNFGQLFSSFDLTFDCVLSVWCMTCTADRNVVRL